MNELKCPLCFEIQDSDNFISFCQDATHDPICKECIKSYCVHKIENSFVGTCPTMICPCLKEHVNNEDRLLEFSKWTASDVVSSYDVKSFKNLASSLLLFLCAGCHTMRYV